MRITQEHLVVAAEGLPAAAHSLRHQAGAGAGGLDFYGDLGDDVPAVQAHLRRWAASPDWHAFHTMPSVHGLLLAESLRLAGVTEAPPAFDGTTGIPRGEPTIWFGDVTIPGSLSLDAPLIVLGDLTVTGLLDDGDVDRSYFAAAGDVRARAVHSGADHFVLGSLYADVIVCFNNDGSLVVGGDLVTQLFAPCEHCYGVEGEVRARAIGEGDSDDEVLAGIEPWLPPEYVTRDSRGHLDLYPLLDAAAAGNSPVLAHPASDSGEGEQVAHVRPGQGR